MPPILAAVRDRLPDLQMVIQFSEWERFCASGDGASLPDVDPGSPAQILYTSGTTGRPKAAVLTHRGLTNNARLAAEAIGMRAGESLINPMPLFHVAGAAITSAPCRPSAPKYRRRDSTRPCCSSSLRPTAAPRSAACQPC